MKSPSSLLSVRKFSGTIMVLSVMQTHDLLPKMFLTDDFALPPSIPPRSDSIGRLEIRGRPDAWTGGRFRSPFLISR